MFHFYAGVQKWNIGLNELTKWSCTAQKIKLSIKDFFIKCDQICSFLRIWSHLSKEILHEKPSFFCSVTGNFEYVQACCVCMLICAGQLGLLCCFFILKKKSNKIYVKFNYIARINLVSLHPVLDGFCNGEFSFDLKYQSRFHQRKIDAKVRYSLKSQSKESV